ncbi:MAG: efflux RND transporter periplasmic adaptor subunit [Patescibacteria group bacterium]|nr:efflux RND transporter periplasmic adaptor subunit [Patescibacteria group bacterium]
MSRKKKILIVIGAILMFAVIVFIVRRDKDEVEYKTEGAQLKSIQQTVSATGELVSEEEINLNFETSGRIKTIKTFVGKKVAKGEILATIDADEFGQQLRQAEASLEQALASAGANDDVTREAEEVYDDAKDFLGATEELEDQKVDAVDQAFEDADDYYDIVKDYYDQEVADHGASSQEANYARISLKSAESSKNAAEEAKSTTRKAREVSIQSAENSKNLASERLRSAKSEYVKRSSDFAVESARATYNIALMNLDKTSLKAPANGVITQVTYKVGEVLGSASFDLASSATTASARMISSDFVIESQIPESDVTKIKKGQGATVTFDALNESETFASEVIGIEPAATVIQDVVYYKIKLRLSNLDARLKSGMSADVDIHTAEKSDVIAIPQRAVKELDGRKIVEVLSEDGNINRVEVKTGLRGDNGLIEIVSGLDGGESVITFVLNEKEE